MSSDSESDTDIDEVVLDSRFDETVANSKAKATRAIYKRMLTRLRKGLKVADDAPVESMNENEVLNFITLDSVKEDGSLKSASTPEAYRSALLYHFRTNNLPLPHNYEVVLNNFVKGHKANVATARQEGNMKATEGKDAIDFNTYKELSHRAWATRSADDALFFVLAWNMSCRATSANSVNLSHIQWREDCLFFTIPKSKTTQRGAQRGVDHAFSVYANPFDPSICCVLALGVKVLCTTMVREGGSLFAIMETLRTVAQNVRLKNKNLSQAKTLIAAMDQLLPHNYQNLNYTAKDDAFRIACRELCKKMVDCGHKASPETLMSKVIKNKYPSIYENDWKFVLKKKFV